MHKTFGFSVLFSTFCSLVMFSTSTVRAQTPTLDSEEWAFLTLINNYRAQNGAGPLQVSVALENSSTWMSNDMATKNYFSHTDSLGRDPFTRMAAFGYSYTPAGENIAAGNSTAQASFTQWQTACDADASGNCTYAHRQNMLNGSYKVIGIARAYSASSTYGWYWTTDFGGVVDATITPPTVTPPTAVSVSPTSGSGATQTFSYVYSDANGYADIGVAEALISATGQGANSCWVAYYPSSNTMYLANDAGTAWSGPLTPGSSSNLQNTQCTLGGPGSSANRTGTSVTLNLSLTFSSGFSGAKNNYSFVQNIGGQNSGLQKLGTWTVGGGGAPAANSVTPASGSGAAQTFSYSYTDPNGYADINVAEALISANGQGTNACWVVYYPSSNVMYMANDAATAWSGPLTPGSSGTLQNSQCTLNGQGSSANGAGTGLTIAVNLTFKSAFNGAKTNYAFVQNYSGANRGLQKVGSWTVGAGGAPTAVSVTPNSASGSAQVFTYVYNDSNGYADINVVEQLISTNGQAANACWVVYYPASNVFYLANDSTSAWSGPLAPGSSSTLQNSQCTLSGQNTSGSGTGTTLTVKLNLTFKAAFNGTQANNAYVQSASGQNSGWQKLGSWIVP